MSQSSHNNAIIIFAKSPEIGKVKTRLACDTSDQFAVAFYKTCLQYLLNELHHNESDILLYLTPDSNQEYFLDYQVDQVLFQINDSNLGQRMATALEEQLPFYQKVLLIGSDIPSLNNELLAAAQDALTDHHAVIGPAEDGGYYLIGFSQGNFINCFNNIEWSTETVLATTLKQLENIPLHILPICSDVDTLQDLHNLSEKKQLPLIIQEFLKGYPQWF